MVWIEADTESEKCCKEEALSVHQQLAQEGYKAFLADKELSV